MNNDKNGLRMYFFVLYSLSGIQKGIQAGHCSLEYSQEYGKTKRYKDFVKNHKTFILLDGGGSGEMEKRVNELVELGVDFAIFREPDLNDSISAIAFIVPQSVYGLQDWYLECEDPVGATKEVLLAKYLKGFRLASN